jgi:hypothetical protein
MIRPATCFFLFLICICLQNCRSQQKDCVFQQWITAQKDRVNYYGKYNFIISQNGQLYYHSKDSIMNCCDTGMDYQYPDYIDLQPSDLLTVDEQQVANFIDSSLTEEPTKHASIYLAYFSKNQTDQLKHLTDLLKQKSACNYAIRSATEEEREVLKAKMGARPYDFHKVEWKSRFSGTVFPPPAVK